MRYDDIAPGRFVSRPNRFIAYVEVDGETHACHVKNTGRCKELLLPGAEVYLQKSSNPARKTAYSLITVRKGGQLVNIDSTAPNAVFAEWAADSGHWPGPLHIQPEVKYGDSRIDFRLDMPGQQIYVEVKGVTLERGGVALFPDAPTERGVKHIRELIRCASEGFGAAIAFIIQMKGVHAFCPHDAMHPAFGEELLRAHDSGVKLLALDCAVTVDSIAIDSRIPIEL